MELKNKQTEGRRAFIINCVYFAIILVAAYLFVRYAAGPLAPFLVALLIALAVRPLARLLQRRLGLGYRLSTAFALIVFYAVVGLLLALLGLRLVITLSDLVAAMPTIYTSSIAPALTDLFDNVMDWAARLDPEWAALVETASKELTSSLGAAVTTASVTVVGWLSRTAGSVPGALLKVLITVIASFFIALDYPLISAFAARQLPEKGLELVRRVREGLGGTLGGYIRSYALIMLMTFGELTVGLLIIGVNNAPVIALAIAVFDILPIVGSGLVLFPWVVVSFIQGELWRGVGLAVLWLVMIVVRNIMEPRIIGSKVGLHPLLTLSGMVIGTALFGGLGLFLVPITLALLKRLNEEGAIHLYKPLAGPVDGQQQPGQDPVRGVAPPASESKG